jgi:hypothetical protein
MEDLFLVLGWPGPIGVGAFLALLGTFIWLLAKADEVKARTNALKKEKGLDKKKWPKE